MTIEAQILADDVGIGVEATTPEAIANEDSGRSVENLLVGRKFAAQHGGNSPDLKETGGDPSPSYPFREREGLEEDGIDSGEDGTVCANGKGQGEDDGGREGWGFTDEAKRGFDIGHRGVQEPDAVDFADFLFNLFTPAEFQHRLPARLFGCHARGDVVVGQLFNVKAKLLIELRVQGAFAKK